MLKRNLYVLLMTGFVEENLYSAKREDLIRRALPYSTTIVNQDLRKALLPKEL
jgi:hypothetical protein